MTLGPGARVGPYRLGPLLGRGGMAVVYEATHEAVGRTVALKLISPDLVDPQFIERFRREGRMQAALDHPHAVTVFEAGNSEYGPYLAMRLVRGTTLAGLIDDGVLTSARTLDLLEQVAEALDAAHAAGFVHRDVKPRNVLVEAPDQAFLADFGLTRQGDTGATATGRFMGTVAYAAPEVVAGGAAGPAADRYALAVVLFECLTGSTAFPRPTTTAILYAHTAEPPPRVTGRRAEAPPALDEVLMAGLAKYPDRRPGSAAELIRRARAALGDAVLEPPAPRLVQAAQHATITTGEDVLSPPEPPRRPARWPALAALLAGAAIGAATFAVLDEDPAPRPAAVALPPAPAGTLSLGPALDESARTVGCDGAPVSADSPNCMIFQDRLADGTQLIVQRSGAIVRWGVRGAVGELALAVLRRDGENYFQLARSRTEFVGSPDPHFFDTDMFVESGDRLGLVVVPGSGFGVRDADGASTGTFTPSELGAGQPPATGIAAELALSADYEPGRRPPQPVTLRGREAETAPAGRLIDSDRTEFPNGEPVQVRVVELDDGSGAIDLFSMGRRTARAGIPGFISGSQVLQLDIIAFGPGPRRAGVGVRFTIADSSQRLVSRFYDVFGDRIKYNN